MASDQLEFPFYTLGCSSDPYISRSLYDFPVDKVCGVFHGRDIPDHGLSDIALPQYHPDRDLLPGNKKSR